MLLYKTFVQSTTLYNKVMLQCRFTGIRTIVVHLVQTTQDITLPFWNGGQGTPGAQEPIT